MIDVETKYSKMRKEIQSLTLLQRNKSKNKRTKHKIDLMHPASSWIKKERMHEGIGNEFTIILRTKACSWARSTESGGCTMCGYYNDRGPDNITQNQVLSQFNFALKKHGEKIKEIREKNDVISLKLYTSGSFLDDDEINSETRKSIFRIIALHDCFREIIIESRPEFISNENGKLDELKVILGEDKILEVGIGLESSNKFVREILINKGVTLEDIKVSFDNCHRCGLKVKAYILLKPAFLSEKIAIKDAVRTINDAIDLGADTISLNPVNIQANTLIEQIYYWKKYRSPWIYSVIEVLRLALDNDKMKKVMVICDPSAKGRKRGVHNCNSKECNNEWLDILKEFVFTQNIGLLEKSNLPYGKCKCWGEYNLYLDYSKN
ncbi:MAG: archaeosine biosynthesis radical SAM protein RaSEA [Promethearchaeota archaeon]